MNWFSLQPWLGAGAGGEAQVLSSPGAPQGEHRESLCPALLCSALLWGICSPQVPGSPQGCHKKGLKEHRKRGRGGRRGQERRGRKSLTLMFGKSQNEESSYINETGFFLVLNVPGSFPEIITRSSLNWHWCIFECVGFRNSLHMTGQEMKQVNNLQPFILLLELLSV